MGDRMPQVYLIQINVTDMDKAIDWYTNVLGFKLSKQHYHYPIAVDLVHEGARLILHTVDKPANIDYPNVAQTLISIRTEDIEASLKDLKSKGVEIIYETPLEFPMGLYAAFRDPFGNVHELVETRSG